MVDDRWLTDGLLSSRRNRFPMCKSGKRTIAEMRDLCTRCVEQPMDEGCLPRRCAACCVANTLWFNFPVTYCAVHKDFVQSVAGRLKRMNRNYEGLTIDDDFDVQISDCLSQIRACPDYVREDQGPEGEPKGASYTKHFMTQLACRYQGRAFPVRGREDAASASAGAGAGPGDGTETELGRRRTRWTSSCARRPNSGPGWRGSRGCAPSPSSPCR